MLQRPHKRRRRPFRVVWRRMGVRAWLWVGVALVAVWVIALRLGS